MAKKTRSQNSHAWAPLNFRLMQQFANSVLNKYFGFECNSNLRVSTGTYRSQEKKYFSCCPQLPESIA